jgi:hypothetical protein
MMTRNEQGEGGRTKTLSPMTRKNFPIRADDIQRALARRYLEEYTMADGALRVDYGANVTASDVRMMFIRESYMKDRRVAEPAPGQPPVQVPHAYMVAAQNARWGEACQIIMDKGGVGETLKGSLGGIRSPRVLWTRLEALYAGGQRDLQLSMHLDGQLRAIKLPLTWAALRVAGAMQGYIMNKKQKWEEAKRAGSNMSPQVYQMHLVEGAAAAQQIKDETGVNQTHPYWDVRKHFAVQLDHPGAAPYGLREYDVEDGLNRAERDYQRQLVMEGKTITSAPSPSAPPVHQGGGEYEEKVASLKAADNAKERDHQDMINMSYQAGRAAGQNSNGQGGGASRVTCFNCGNRGHYKSDCRKKGGGGHVDKNKDK